MLKDTVQGWFVNWGAKRRSPNRTKTGTGDKPLHTLKVTIRWEDNQKHSREWHYVAHLAQLDASKASRLAWTAFRQERKQYGDWNSVFNPKISCEVVE